MVPDLIDKMNNEIYHTLRTADISKDNIEDTRSKSLPLPYALYVYELLFDIDVVRIGCRNVHILF